MIKIPCRPVRNAWLKAVYEYGIIKADQETQLLADKLYFYKKLAAYAPDDISQFHPYTMGLAEWCHKHQLDLEKTTRENIESALKNSFPKGAILKPSTVINSGGEVGLYIFKNEQIVNELYQRNPNLMTAIAQAGHWISPLLNTLASGEEFILQENIATLAGYQEFEKSKMLQEIRIHTYEGQVLRGASYSRWASNEIKNERHFYLAQDYVQDFLDILPNEFLKNQAWGLDILVFDNGFMRILEINTNRGQRSQWSGFLSRPELIGAYTRAFEQSKQLRFSGIGGFLLRNNLGNVTKHWKKKYIEGIQ